MPVQLQLNQGPQDALLYDNSRSYFSNVGYVRTSNFQIEYKDVEPQSAAGWGRATSFIIPKAADLLGPLDLIVDIPEVTADEATRLFSGSLAANDVAYAQWVDELGFAMLDKVTFSVGPTEVETITGEQMRIKNELMTSDEMRYGFEHVMKTGKRAFSKSFPVSDGTNNVAVPMPQPAEVPLLPYPANTSVHMYDNVLEQRVQQDYTRLIGYCAENCPYDGHATDATTTHTQDKVPHLR